VTVVVPRGVALDMTGWAMFGEQHADAATSGCPPARRSSTSVRARRSAG
jgi:hypothetical protein